jgi:hypothetical protein
MKRISNTAYWILGAALGVGALLGTFADANQVVTKSITYWGTAGVILACAVLEFYARVFGVRRGAIDSQVRYRSFIPWLPAVAIGLILPLWIPRIFSRHDEPPTVTFGWYKKTPNGLRLVDPSNIVVEVSPADVRSGTVPIPLNIAIQNKENADLEVVRIELTYDQENPVTSAGRAKIDPTNRTLIYEHSLGTLAPVESFTPIEEVDVVRVPFRFLLVDTIVLLRDGVPANMVTLVGYSGAALSDRIVAFGIKVLCRDRPPMVGTIRLRLGLGVDLIGETAEGTPSALPPDQVAQFVSWTETPEATLASWTDTYPVGNIPISYSKIRSGGRILQVVSVDRQLRRINVDSDGDGAMEYSLLDTNTDGILDMRATYLAPQFMYDWRKEALSEASSIDRK